MDSNELLSNVEMAILGALSKPVDDTEKVVGRSNNGREEVIYKTSTLPMKRQSRYVTFSFGPDTDEDHRLFSDDMEMLLKVPDSDFGVIMVADSLIKESSFTKLANVPKGYAAYGSYDSVWQLDFIGTLTHNLKSKHIQQVLAVKGRKVVALYPVRTPKQILTRFRQRDNREVSTSFALSASVLEDYNLNQFWHVDITDSVTIATYAKEREVKSFLDIRTEPLTKTGQRKRVLHWVSGHRRMIGNKTTEVAKHLRGLDQFKLGGFDIAITQPQKHCV